MLAEDEDLWLLDTLGIFTTKPELLLQIIWQDEGGAERPGYSGETSSQQLAAETRPPGPRRRRDLATKILNFGLRPHGHRVGRQRGSSGAFLIFSLPLIFFPL